MFKIENMNFIAGTENEFIHFGIPEAGLVAKMDTGLQHVTHGHSSHNDIFLVRVKPPHIPPVNPHCRHPDRCVDTCVSLRLRYARNHWLQSGALYTTKGDFIEDETAISGESATD